ncbi:FAD-dependent oxidoreductase [Spirosoma sp. KUDC1026]|uniref:FAD-dependent oxidoreductase n=1 Tax=Spirosoma sp. KUDC1026 TaxID=2745947 RepID=UPI00159BD077|nr:NAD(P)/FAD-dependent oxidoreductase [Spirosoma sp. KUDC1026]QKZ13739.1 FAD-dependent monooxygenase [Spirosoma sp. KUDC1026]
MLLTDKEVAILGAGPVGLTLAKLLQQAGVTVTVYERDEDAQARIWGGTLDLHETTGQEALARAGLLEQYFARALPMGRIVADEQGNVLFSRGPATDSPEINRNELRTLLLHSLADGTVVWDRKFTGLNVHDGKWQLQFENSQRATADLVIGANGGMSAVRTYITDATVEYTGTVFIQGEVADPQRACPAFYELCQGNILMASHKGNLFGANPKNNGTLTYNVILSESDEWLNEHLNFQDTAGIVQFLSDRFSDWHAVYKQLFQATNLFRALPIRKLPLTKPWKQDRPLPITVVGDAAHLMQPFAGQGVNTGLVDALTLSDNLTNGKFTTLQAAISDYEQKMLVYATAAQRASNQNELALRHPDFSFQNLFHGAVEKTGSDH